MHSQNGAMSRVSFGVYKPRAGCHTDDVVAQMLRTAASIEKRSTNINITVLRCIRGDWVAAVAENKATEDANPWLNLPEAATFTKGLSSVIQTVDAGWFELACEERKEGFSFGQKRVGDVVSVRKIYSEGKNQDKLSYCCLAVLKSYFTNTKGLNSYRYYTSLDGKSIIGLANWESEDLAFNKENRCTGETFLKSLGAKKLRYDVCRVVYATDLNE